MKYLTSFGLNFPTENILGNMSAPVLAIFLVLSLVLLWLLRYGLLMLIGRLAVISIGFLVTMTNIYNRLKKSKNRAIVWIVLIVAMVVVAIFASCTTSHRVSQSASTFKSGDTLTTTIIYQQTGNLKKR
jgi:Kef-type K+ transport system membrane component KefB